MRRRSINSFLFLVFVAFILSTAFSMIVCAQENLHPNSFRYGQGAYLEKMSMEKMSMEEMDLEAIADVASVLSMTPSEAKAKGIDVSSYQRDINWDIVKPYIDFAYIRCGFGDDITSQDDAYWLKNVTACERLGIPYGVYLYSYATDTNHARSEAAHALRLLAGHHPSLPVFYDLEDQTMLSSCTQAQILEFTTIFCNAMENAGYQAGVYANTYWWGYILTSNSYSKWPKWVAQYNSMCTYDGNYDFWQYTGSGTLPGINYPVDMDYCRKPISALTKSSGTTTPQPTVTVPTEPEKPKEKYALNLKGYFGGNDLDSIGKYATCDIYINGSRVANDCKTFSKTNGEWESGSTYEIKDIKLTACTKYDGVKSGSIKGTITKNTTVRLSFSREHNYVTTKIKGTCTKLGGTNYTCSGCGDSYDVMDKDDWSSWSEKYPTQANPDFVESRKEYSYSDKEVTTSTKSSLAGWTKLGKKNGYTAWSEWGPWQTKKITSSATTNVETGKIYRYFAYVCPSCGRREPLPGMSDCGKTKLTSSHLQVLWSTVSYQNSASKLCTNADGKNRRYTTSLGDGKMWIFDGTCLKKTAAGTKDSASTLTITTGYRAKTRKKATIYSYERWKAYTSWSIKQVTGSATRIVKTRTVYRYNKAQKINHSYKEIEIKNNKLIRECTVCHKKHEETVLSVKNVSGTRVVTIADTKKIKAKGYIYVKEAKGTLKSNGVKKKTLPKIGADGTYSVTPDKELLKQGYYIRFYVKLDSGTTIYM